MKNIVLLSLESSKDNYYYSRSERTAFLRSFFYAFYFPIHSFCMFALLLRMKRLLFYTFFIIMSFAAFAHKPQDTLSLSKVQFIPNQGQWNGGFMFKTPLNGGALFFDSCGVVVTLLDPNSLEQLHESKYNGSSEANFNISAAAYRISFVGSNHKCDFLPVGPSCPYYFNYYTSHNSDQWRSKVPVYSKLQCPSIYDGVDMFIYQQCDYIKYDFVVAPRTDPSCVRIKYEGVKSLSVLSNNLIVDNGLSRVVELEPVAYQINDSGDTSFVSCSYLIDKDVVSFKFGDYDNSKDLVIDPAVVFSSYSGSVADNWGYTATYDSYGNLFGGGIAFGVGYPITFGVFQTNFCDGTGSMLTDVSISKFDATGSSLLYSTYLGGSYVDIPHSLFVNENDELYVFGTTGSPDFPVTTDAFDTSFNYGSSKTLSTSLSFPLGSDIFIAKFSENADQLLGSTFIGGLSNDGINVAQQLCKNYADDNRGEILVDANSNVYVVSSTYSPDFPVTPQAFDTTFSGGQDICVFKMSQDLSQLIWSTFLGGAQSDAGYSISLAPDNSVYVCGGTLSDDYPVIQPAIQTSLSGGVDGVVSHLSANGDQLLHSTYLGRVGYDQIYLIKGDRNGVPHVLGQTDAEGSTWIHNAQYAIPNGGQFLSKLSEGLDSVIWSTSFGTGNGGPDISPTALMVDYCNNIYMSGWGSRQLNGFGGTSGLPVTSDAFQTTTDGSDYYFLSLSEDASQLVYATYFGGATSSAREHVDGGTSRFDRKGRIYQAVCAGCGGQSSFPTTPGAYSTQNGSSNCNLGVIKMDFSLPVVVADFRLPTSLCAPDTVVFQNLSQSVGTNTSYLWDFGDGTTSTDPSPAHFYGHSGYYQISLVVRDNGSCNLSDTLVKYLLVLANTTDSLPAVPVCQGDFVQIGLPPSNEVTYQWSPSQFLSNPALSNPFATPDQSMMYRLIASSEACVDTIFQYVQVDTLEVTLCPDTVVCQGGSAVLSIVAPPDCQSVEWSTHSNFTTVFSRQTAVEVQPAVSTTYYVRVVRGVCTFVGSVTVSVSDIEVEPLPDILICFEDSVQLSVIHSGDDGVTYQWTLDDGSIYVDSQPWVSPENSTLYAVTVTNQYGCSAAASGNIVKRTGTFPTPFSVWCDVCEIVQAHSTTVFSTDYGPGYLYQWTPTQDMETPNSPSSLVHPLESTLYSVSVTDTFGCSLTNMLTIEVHELTCDEPYIYVPNAFSPNGDGKNDVLFVRSEILEDFYFAVYSRWGEKVFECASLEVGWDGTYKGKPCQNGVYDYYFSGTCVGGKTKELKGNVMLVR